MPGLVPAVSLPEPTRRDSCPSTAEFSAERIIAQTPADGKVMTTSASYLTIGDGLYCRLMSTQAAKNDATFTQDRRGTSRNSSRTGILPAFIARAGAANGQFPVFHTYQPDTVVDLSSLLELASSLGIDITALQRELDNFYRAQVMGLGDFRYWDKGLLAVVILVVMRPARSLPKICPSMRR